MASSPRMGASPPFPSRRKGVGDSILNRGRKKSFGLSRQIPLAADGASLLTHSVTRWVWWSHSTMVPAPCCWSGCECVRKQRRPAWTAGALRSACARSHVKKALRRKKDSPKPFSARWSNRAGGRFFSVKWPARFRLCWAGRRTSAGGGSASPTRWNSPSASAAARPAASIPDEADVLIQGLGRGGTADQRVVIDLDDHRIRGVR